MKFSNLFNIVNSREKLQLEQSVNHCNLLVYNKHNKTWIFDKTMKKINVIRIYLLGCYFHRTERPNRFFLVHYIVSFILHQHWQILYQHCSVAHLHGFTFHYKRMFVNDKPTRFFTFTLSVPLPQWVHVSVASNVNV